MPFPAPSASDARPPPELDITEPDEIGGPELEPDAMALDIADSEPDVAASEVAGSDEELDSLVEVLLLVDELEVVVDLEPQAASVMVATTIAATAARRVGAFTERVLLLGWVGVTGFSAGQT